MAALVLFSVAGGILTKLDSLLLPGIGLYRGTKAELLKLKDIVTELQAVLLDAENRSRTSDAIKVWLSELKDAMYDADDLLDELSAVALQRDVVAGNRMAKQLRLFFSGANQLVSREMARKIKGLRRRLRFIATTKREFVFHKVLSEDKEEMERSSYSAVPDRVVGREKAGKDVLHSLLSRVYKQNVAIVSLVGIGGIGKTTLAQMVFNKQIVGMKFALKFWVRASDNFDLPQIAKKMLSAAGGIDMNPAMDILLLLHKMINGRKYLLVLDDVWNEDVERWSELRDMLECGARGSRILITTRLERVAIAAGSNVMHLLQGLNMSASWLLFSQIAFNGGEVPSAEHEKIGKQIVEKCRGVPFAIKAVGALLHLKHDISDWKLFKNEDISEIGQGENSVLQILKLSYNHLPSHLKHCFAYCQLFPKGHTINVPKLINLWIAQGYVKQPGSDQCAEDLGLAFFVALLSRSFFQEAERNEWGDIITCKMHNLMHELATEVGGVESLVSKSDGDLIDSKVHHVSFYADSCSPWKAPSSLFEARNMRTFILLNEPRTYLGAVEPGCVLEEQQCHLITSSLRRLRVLDLHSSSISKLPQSICKLKLLVSLDLSENKGIELLPDSIIRLQKLQILKLDNCSRLKQLPKDTKQLASLIHLGIENCSDLSHMPRGIGKLTSLSTLSRFVVAIDSSISKDSGKLGELGALNGLRGTLKIYNLPHAKNAISQFRAANLQEKQHLQALRLEWSDGDEDDNDNAANELGDDKLALVELQPHLSLERLELREYRGLEFPSWLSSLTNLVAIALESCEKCQHLPPLHQLTRLKCLTIEGLTALEYVNDGAMTRGGSKDFFPSLEKLVLSDCPKLKGWWKSAPTTSPELELPCLGHLSDLSIVACPRMTSMPMFAPLKSLKFSNASMGMLEYLLNRMIVPGELSASASSSSSASYSSSSLALSQLHALDIGAINDLEYFQENLVKKLSSLKSLRVSSCRKLKSLLQAIRHLTSLTTLSIETCEEVDLCDGHNDDDAVQWQGLRSLRYLSIDRIPKLVSLPDWIQHLTLLQKLEISGCRNLKSLPEWMTKLCALQLLTITWCPLLSHRCRSEDWLKIKHIPNIIVAREIVQGNWIL